MPPQPAHVRNKEEPMNSLDPQARAAADQGNLVEAIKLVREKTGLGLKEAKEAVEAYLGGSERQVSAPDTGIPLVAISALQDGKLIDAIRLTRDATRLGLKESKGAVERYLADHPMARDQFREAVRRNSRPLRTAFFLALIVAAVVVAVRALS
jgi:ribosomal protein L7/L12